MSNLFDPATLYSVAGTNAALSNSIAVGGVSDLAANGNVVSTIFQPFTKPAVGNVNERLYLTRARYGATYLNESGGKNLEGSRGQWAYIKLLTSQKQFLEYTGNTSSRDVTYKDLLGPEGPVAFMSDPTNTNTKPGYDRFLLTGVSCSMNEKVQISEVFGDSEVVYYFGREPLIFNLSGVLVDSADNLWFTDWLKLYSDFLRGSQTARNYELIKIVLPNMAITGTISGFSWQQDSNRDVDIGFSFQFIAKVVEPLPVAGSKENMISNKVSKVNFATVAKLIPQSQINSLKNQIGGLTSIIQNPSSSLKDKSDAMSKIGSGLGGTFDSFLASSGSSISSFQKTIDGWTKSSVSAVNSIKSTSMFQTVTSSLNGIRTNLFSPIYGVLSSLTKLVTNVFGAATSVFNALVTPVRNILRDITNISNQAVALVNTVNSAIKGFGRNISGQLKGVSSDYQAAIKALNRAAGAIGSAPRSVAHTIADMFSNGVVTSGAPFLANTPKLTFTRPTLSSGGSIPKTKVALLQSVAVYSSSTANVL